MTRFMVQWADHPSHLATRLGQLLEHQTLVDVTLMCNTHTLRVHRAVLAAGSPYFETILQRQLGQHPLIVLKDMQFTVLKCLIEFMYCGETSVTEDNLPALLQAAKFFQVRGLSAMTKEALGLKSSPSDLAINGAGDASTAPSVQTPQVTLPRPGTKRVNIEGKPTPNKQRAVLKPRSIPAEAQGSPKSRTTGPAGDVPRMTFHTIPKTVPTRPLSSRSTETQADNARLLLSLSGSESFHAKSVTSAPPATVLGRPRQPHTPLSGAKSVAKPASAGNKNIRFHHNVSGIIPPIGTKLTLHEGVNRVVTTPKRRGRPPARTSVPKTLTPALKLALENQAKNKVISPKLAVPEPAVPMEFVAVEKEETGSNVEGDEKTPTLYRDPNTNILYQVDDTPATEETETIIYQLPDGTITDKDGNAIMDEEGNTQNINNYQMERGGGDVVYQMEGATGEEEGNVVYQMEGAGEGTEEATEGGGESLTHSQYMDVLKRAGLPTDMPILLDSGDGNYVAVNEEVLRNIVDGGVLQCQVTEGNLVREDGEEFLVQPEETVEEPQEQAEEPMQQEEAIEQLEQEDDEDGNNVAMQQQQEEEEEEEAEEVEEEEEEKCGEEMTVVGKSLPSLDDEGEEEVITGDPYGELSFHTEATGDHNFSSQEEGNDIVQEEGNDIVEEEGNDIVEEEGNDIVEEEGNDIVEEEGNDIVEEEGNDIVEEETSTELDQTEFVFEEQKESSEDGTKPAISVEQALEEMMGEEEEEEEDGKEAETTGDLESDRQSELDNLQSVLNSSMESSTANGTFRNNDGSLTNQTEGDEGSGECPAKTSSLLKNALRESGIVAEGDLDETVYEMTTEGVSPSKDIPYAVGLLPLQTALEKIRSMPDHQPRKTRSSDEPAAARNKRRASTNADGPEKRAKLSGGEEDAFGERGDDMEALIPELADD